MCTSGHSCCVTTKRCVPDGTLCRARVRRFESAHDDPDVCDGGSDYRLEFHDIGNPHSGGTRVCCAHATPPSAPPALGPYGEDFHGLSNGNWSLNLRIEEKTNQVIYFRPYGSGGYLEAGDQVQYVLLGLGCSDAARANYPMDQGEGQDYGGIVNLDANGALTTTVNMLKLTSQQYQACYLKPMTLTGIVSVGVLVPGRRKLDVVHGNWAEVDAYISVDPSGDANIGDSEGGGGDDGGTVLTEPHYWVHDGSTSRSHFEAPGVCTAATRTALTRPRPTPPTRWTDRGTAGSTSRTRCRSD